MVENEKLIAYIASPVHFWYIGRSEKQAERCVSNYARKLCVLAKERGYIPVSMPMIFTKVYSESTEREIALSDCLSVLKKCDVFFYNKKDYALSRGIQDELVLAKKLGLEIVEIDEAV